MKIIQSGNKIEIYRKILIQVPRVNKPPIEKTGYELLMKINQSEYDDLREAMHAHELERWNKSMDTLLRRRNHEAIRAD